MSKDGMDIDKIVSELKFRTLTEYAAALGCSPSNISHQKRRIREGRPPGRIVRGQIERLAAARGIKLVIETPPPVWTWGDVTQDANG